MDYRVNVLDNASVSETRRRWDAVAKPLHSLGRLEDMISQIAGIQQTPDIALSPRCALVFCADHGVVAEGVAQSGSEVTALVVKSIIQGDANINHMAAVSGTDVFAVDMGMLQDADGAINRKISRGTRNLAKELAMTRVEAEASIQAGIDLAGDMRRRGYRMIATGEMGIGNTTASTAIACSLLDLEPEEITGRGAGLSDSGLMRKTKIIRQALTLHRPDAGDPIDVLSKVGGYEIAGMTGAFIGGMTERIPTVIDGVISAAAALLAVRICPQVRDFLLPSHMSREGAMPKIMQELGLEPVLFADLALGEGTGAVALFPLLDMAYSVYQSVHTFDSLGMEAYTPQGGKS